MRVTLKDLKETEGSSRVMEAPTDADEPEGGKLSRFTVLVIFLDVGGKVLTTMMGCLLCVEAESALAGLELPGRRYCFSCVINSSRHRWQAWAVVAVGLIITVSVTSRESATAYTSHLFTIVKQKMKLSRKSLWSQLHNGRESVECYF